MGEENKPSDIIQETIKKKPVNKKKLVIRICYVAAFAVAAGIIASLVFVNFIPVAEKVSGKEKKPEKITLVSVGTTPSVTPTPTIEQKKTTTPTPTPTPKPEKDKDKEEKQPEVTPVVTPEPVEYELALSDYDKLYSEMTEATANLQKSLVTVTGITSQDDYFNETFENTQQLKGIIVAETDTDIYILTSYSILENVDRIQVEFPDSHIADAIFQKHDRLTQLAVLKVDITEFPEETLKEIAPVSFNDNVSVKMGQATVAVGKYNGIGDSIEFGAVTSVDSVMSVYDHGYRLITTNICCVENASGLLSDINGNLIGIIMPGMNTGNSAMLTSYMASEIKPLIEKLTNSESRAYFGITGSEVTSQIADRTGIPKGLLITDVEGDSPAMLSGLLSGDVIVKIDDQDVLTNAAFEALLSGIEPSKRLKVTAMRKGAEGYTEVAFEVTLGEV